MTYLSNAGDSAPRSVIIIGAGFAGLAAARQLFCCSESPKVDIKILEAGDRVGGRAWTHTLPAFGKTEFGAT